MYLYWKKTMKNRCAKAAYSSSSPSTVTFAKASVNSILINSFRLRFVFMDNSSSWAIVSSFIRTETTLCPSSPRRGTFRVIVISCFCIQSPLNRIDCILTLEICIYYNTVVYFKLHICSVWEETPLCFIANEKRTRIRIHYFQRRFIH